MIGLLMLAAAVGAKGDPRCTAKVGFYQPPKGVISSPAVARAAAEIYLNAIYGADLISREEPLRVSIARQVWHVEGQLPPRAFGGVAEIDLCQANGQVLRIYHSK